MATASEPEWIDAARRGDAAALSALVTAEQSRVFRFALKMCRLREDAEDVLQDTLLAAGVNPRGDRPSRPLRTR